MSLWCQVAGTDASLGWGYFIDKARIQLKIDRQNCKPGTGKGQAINKQHELDDARTSEPNTRNDIRPGNGEELENWDRGVVTSVSDEWVRVLTQCGSKYTQ